MGGKEDTTERILRVVESLVDRRNEETGAAPSFTARQDPAPPSDALA